MMTKFKILSINFWINKKRYNTLNSAYANVSNTFYMLPRQMLLTFTL